tara:strand:+ start:169 stop:1482 length:1314 start_codon:yes stop_codon:yes gene_type:complete
MNKLLGNSFVLKKDIFTVVEYSSFLMAFFLPLAIELSNLFLIIFFVSSAYQLIIKKKYVKTKFTILLYSTIILYFLSFFGLFFTETPSESVVILERNLSFLLCPLLLFFHSNKNLLIIKDKLFKGLVLGCVFSILILITNNLFNYFQTRPLFIFDNEIFSYYYTYYYFTNLLDIHPTYLGAYVVFSITILINKLINLKTQSNKTIYLFELFLLSLGVLFLNSRIIIVIYIIIIICFLSWKLIQLFKNKNYKYGLIVIVLLVTFILSIFTTSLSKTFIYSRLTKELTWELSDQKQTKFNSKVESDSRISRWNSAIKVIKKRPIFGYGTYTEKNILTYQYKIDGLLTSYNKQYDSHNIYLSYLIDYGIVGFVFLIFYLGSNIFLAIKSKNFEYFVFFCMIGVICIFESYLKNNAAITFVAFFGTILLFTNPIKTVNDKS